MNAKNEAALMRERIIRRAALEFKDGMYGILFKEEFIVNPRQNEAENSKTFCNRLS